MLEVSGPNKSNNAAMAVTSMSDKNSRPVLKLPTFNWKAQDEYGELLNFEMEVKNIFMSKNYDICENERALVNFNWVGIKD